VKKIKFVFARIQVSFYT